MENLILYGVTLILVILSFVKDRKKTYQAMKKAWKAFENILPQFLAVIVLVGIMLSVLNPDMIGRLLGKASGWWGIFLAVMVGSITLIPGFVAFPTAAMLVGKGAGYAQIGAFISSLMMVGIVTLPIEFKYFGKKVSILRNFLAFLFSFLVAFIIGKVMGG